MKKIFTLILTLMLAHCLLHAQSFTPGNVVIARVGNGAAALANTATPVFLDEYNSAGVFVQTIVLPVTTAGANRSITASGTATSEGFLTRSGDKRYLLVTGYDAAVGTASVAGTASATVNRVVGRIDATGGVNTTTALTDFSTANNPRSAYSTDGTNIWVAGGAGGVRYTTFGATTSTQLSTTVTNIRVINVADGQLYISSGSGTTRIATVGSGLSTTAGQTITNLPGTPATGSPYAFFFADLSAAVPGADVLYVADDAAGIIKYSLVSGSWVSNGTVTGLAVRGLTGIITGSSVTLYATTPANLLTVTDAGGYNVAFTGTVATLATAVTNTAFRGVALAPEVGTLPIVFEYMKGQKTNNGIALNWKVTCLSTSIVMEIERSNSTRGFTSINTIAASQARCAEPFNYTDVQPLPGQNYYRLKMIDIDGKISYSPTVAIANGSKGFEFTGLYPTLVSGDAYLSVSTARATSIFTKITDLNGKIVQNAKRTVPAGGSLIKIDCAKLAPGLYYLTGIAEDGSATTIKFVKF